MSWDISLMRIPSEITSLREIDGNFKNLGPKEEVLSMLAKTFPDGDFSDPTWGRLETDEYSIEFSLDNADPLVEITLHIRGGAAALEPVRKICEKTGWRALDWSGEFIDFDRDPVSSLRKWQQYRDRIIGTRKRQAVPIND